MINKARSVSLGESTMSMCVYAGMNPLPSFTILLLYSVDMSLIFHYLLLLLLVDPESLDINPSTKDFICLSPFTFSSTVTNNVYKDMTYVLSSSRIHMSMSSNALTEVLREEIRLPVYPQVTWDSINALSRGGVLQPTWLVWINKSGWFWWLRSSPKIVKSHHWD